MKFFPDMDNRNFDHKQYQSDVRRQIAFAFLRACESAEVVVEFDVFTRDYQVLKANHAVAVGFQSMVAAYQWILIKGLERIEVNHE